MLTSWLQDIRFGIRHLGRTPGFTGTVILTLALGIGATTAIFTLVDGILLRPLTFSHADRLVAISTLEFPPGVSRTDVAAAAYIASSYPDFFDWQRQNRTFDSLASYDHIRRLFSKTNGEGARVIVGSRVSANLFPTLGVAPMLGRNFTAEEEQPGHRVVILSYELWVSEFASSRDVIGQVVKVSDEPSIVVGVMPPGFHFAIDEPAGFWATFAADTEGPFPGVGIRDSDRLTIIGRMKPMVKISEATADLSTIQAALAQQYPEIRFRSAVAIAPLLEAAVGEARPALKLLMASVGFVLLIGCANAAGLLLARAASRRQEIAVRAALGAGRARIVRQLLIEAVLLALGGGTAGILASIVLLRLGIGYVPENVPRLYNVSLDVRALAFAVLLSGATALIFGLLPAWRMSKSDPANALRESGTSMTSGRGRNRLHHMLVVAETALGFVLLIGSGLLLRSMLNIVHLDPGFETDRRAYFDLALTNTRYPAPKRVAFYQKFLPELAAVPGIERVGSGHPLSGRGTWDTWTNFRITGHVDSPDNPPAGQAAVVTPGYFETLAIPLLRGRLLSEHDNDPKSPPVVIINRSLAREYFPNEDPIGKYLTPKFEHTSEPILPRQIVGIVGDTRTGDPWEPYLPEFFLPYAQDPSHQRPIVVIKVSGDPNSYENTVRKVVARFDRDALVFGYGSLSAVLEKQVSQPRFEAFLVSGFAAIALLLSALGLYAVLSYLVAERSRELGLRIAVGARRSDILGMVLWRALVLGLLGIFTGAVLSLLAGRLVSDL